MLYKIGNVADLLAVKKHLPPAVFETAHKIVAMLDREYGPDRDIDQSDGGFVLIGETVEDVDLIQTVYVDLKRREPEEVNYLSPDMCWINALYLWGNEFGISVFLPLAVAPYNIKKNIN